MTANWTGNWPFQSQKQLYNHKCLFVNSSKPFILHFATFKLFSLFESMLLSEINAVVIRQYQSKSETSESYFRVKLEKREF